MAVDWLAISGLATAGIALVGLVIAYRQLRHQVLGIAEGRRLQILLTYTQRYEAIMDLFPRGVRVGGLHNASAKLASNITFLNAFLKYANLCSEEFYFRGMLPPGHDGEDAWQVWAGEMKQVFRSDVGRACWTKLVAAGHFDSYKTFGAAVSEWQRNVA